MTSMTLRTLLVFALSLRSEDWNDLEDIELNFCDSFGVDNSGLFANSYPFVETNPTVPINSLPTETILDLEFDSGYGTPCFVLLTAWTKNYVYFSHEYDGSDSIMSVKRNPPIMMSPDKNVIY